MMEKRKLEIYDVSSPSKKIKINNETNFEHGEERMEEKEEKTLREWPGPQIKIRDAAPKQEEEQGFLEFKVLFNNGTRESLRLLVELKNIIAKQLPNMPKVYITRLVLDDKHRSLIGIKNGKVIGGITFKCFDKDTMTKFVEVVFCAITANQQVKGYGSRLMNHLKAWAQKNEFFHLLTYADDYAIGYFQRQGFTLEIEIDRKEWDIGFLKYYDNATLMHCHIDKRIDYLEVTTQLRMQRLAFVAKMRELSNQHIIYPGVRDFKNGAVCIDLEKLQGLKEAGWEPGKFRELMSTERQKELFEENKKLLRAIKQDEEVDWPFRAPVEELFPSDAEKYLREVKDPIDLRTIEQKLEKGFYITHEMLLADLQRMVDNCKAYNPKGSVYYEVAEKLNTRYLNNKIEVQVVTVEPGDKKSS